LLLGLTLLGWVLHLEGRQGTVAILVSLRAVAGSLVPLRVPKNDRQILQTLAFGKSYLQTVKMGVTALG